MWDYPCVGVWEVHVIGIRMPVKVKNMFNKDFYPTPREVIEQMGIDCYDKAVLEPSAGKGDIVDYLIANGARQVVACEIVPDLRIILNNKCNLIGDDFLKITSEQISHIDMIVMNPPFSADEKHILYAWEVAPEGCEIIALCNWQTIDNPYSHHRSRLGELINNYGECRNLGDCFTTAERKTNVKVGLVRLFKPVVSSEFDYDGFFYQPDIDSAGDGVVTYNEAYAVVNSYVAALQCFDRCKELSEEMERYTSVTGFGGGFKFIVRDREDGIVSKELFAKQMQRHCWNHIFKKIGIEKYATRGVMEDINKFIESRKNYPFTMRNIYRMIEIIVGTREQIMNRAIVEAVDNFTMHTHENRYGVEGWKTNSGHLLNKKFIVGWIAESWGNRINIRSYSCRNYDHIIDLLKALCYLTGKNFEDIEKGYSLRELSPNTWYDWEFFEFKVFKKGTGHFRFKDEKVWELLNRTYAKIKGHVLPGKI